MSTGASSSGEPGVSQKVSGRSGEARLLHPISLNTHPWPSAGSSVLLLAFQVGTVCQSFRVGLPCPETLRRPSVLRTTPWPPRATRPFLAMVLGHLEEGGEALEEEEAGSHKDRALGHRRLSDPRHEAVSRTPPLCVRVSCVCVCVSRARQLCGRGHRRASELDQREAVEEASSVVRDGWTSLRGALPAQDRRGGTDLQGQL